MLTIKNKTIIILNFAILILITLLAGIIIASNNLVAKFIDTNSNIVYCTFRTILIDEQEITVNYTLGNAVVEVETEENLDIEYKIDNGQWNSYTTPVEVSLTSVFYARLADGNTKYPSTGKQITINNAYTVKRAIEQSTTACTRVGQATDLVANSTKNGVIGINDFDSIYPWNAIKTYNYDVENKRITAWEGDENFAYDGTNGEVLTYIPEFYYKRAIVEENGVQYEYYSISEELIEGYTKSESFSVGRYKTNVINNIAHSKSGVTPTGDKTIADFRIASRNLGTEFGQTDYRYFMLQMLYLVEYADYDAQTVLGMGNVSSNVKNNTGSCDNLGMKSGSIGAGTSGTEGVIYRGIEDFYGNVWEFVDGMNISNNQTWICKDPTQYAVGVYEAPYTELSYINGLANGKATKLGYDENNPEIAIPIEALGNNTTYMTDYYDQSAEGTTVMVGGRYNTNLNAGPWCWCLAKTSEYSLSNIGSRLLQYQPIKQTNTITYNLNGGVLAVGETNPLTYQINGNSFTLNNPTKIGYIFNGWKLTKFNDEIQTGTELNTTVVINTGSIGDREYTAIWTPNPNTPYKVEHYTEQLDGTYALRETQNLTGTTDTTATATVATYPGFIENTSHPSREISGVISGQGNLVLRVYYSVITYTLNYILDGGELVTDNPTTYKVITPEFTLNNPTKDEYIFAGWELTKLNNVAQTSGEPQEIVTIEEGTIQNREYTAIWRPNILFDNVKIGDYVNYNPLATQGYELNSVYTGVTTKTLTRENLSWRVLDKNDITGEITLISEEPTTQTISVNGALGYNNIVYLLNDACDKLYSKSGVGTARSINIDDIEKYSTFNASNYVGYGNSIIPSGNQNYAALWAYEKGFNGQQSGIDESEDGSSVITMPTILAKVTTGYTTSKFTYYEYIISNYLTGTRYNLLVNNGTNKEYWLGSRCIYANGANTHFDIRAIDEGKVKAYSVYYSNDENFTETHSYVPIVSITPNIKTTGKDINGAWDIIEPVYGVKRAISSSETTWTRTDHAIGLQANATKNSVIGINDFDNVYPWSEIKSYNYNTTTDTITAWYGDEDFAYDGTNGEVLTYIPEFYYKREIVIENGIDYEYNYISQIPHVGYTKSEAFSIGRYKMSVVNNIGHSKSGTDPTGNKTIVDFRTSARNLGTEFGQTDYRYFILQMLYLVEYADYDAQTVLGMGNVSSNLKINTGSCDSLGMKSGSIGLGTSGAEGVIYRGIEDFYGNVWEFVDGINIINNQTWICRNPAQYEVGVFETPYIELSYTNGLVNGKATKLGYDENNPEIAIPIEALGNNTTYMTDYYDQSVEGNIVMVGGRYNTNLNAGPWCWCLAKTFEYSLSNVGARLLKYE